MTPCLWTFSQDICEPRATELSSYKSFEEVVELLSAAIVIAFTWEPFKKEALRGCNRASFLLEVAPEVYDAFFNSPIGLRAQYAIGVSHGEAANRRLLAMLEGRLLSFERRNSLPTKEQIHWSLCAPEAKIWIHEREVEIHLGSDTPEILYEPWQQKSESGAGLRAPLGKTLEVMGGWLTSAGVVVPNPEKAFRSKEVHESGFT